MGRAIEKLVGLAAPADPDAAEDAAKGYDVDDCISALPNLTDADLETLDRALDAEAKKRGIVDNDADDQGSGA